MTQKCERCDRIESFKAFCFVDQCNSCFHSIDEVKGHFARETDKAHKTYDPTREMSLEDLNKVLSLTIKKDDALKQILFLNCLLAQSEDSQFNICLAGESSSGKSYNALQAASYFPEQEKIVLSGASPTSIFHDYGKKVKEVFTQDGKVREYRPVLDEDEDRSQFRTMIDFEGKIIIFLDQPNPKLLEVIRSFLSHDQKYSEFRITNRNSKGVNRTEHIVLKGFSSVIFATAASLHDAQEVTRTLILSPETSFEKIDQSLELTAERLTNKLEFEKKLESNPLRASLLLRISLIRSIGKVKFKSESSKDQILDLFGKHRLTKRPRYLRDLPRIYSLCAGHALLNVFNREVKELEDVSLYISLKESDIRAGFKLYESISEANEFNVSPETFEIYKQLILPLHIQRNCGLRLDDIERKYFEVFQRPCDHVRMKSQILPSLKSAGLVSEESDPTDRRRTLYSPTNPSPKQEDGIHFLLYHDSINEAKLLEKLVCPH